MKKENNYTADIVKSEVKYEERQLEVIEMLSDWGQKAEDHALKQSASILQQLFSRPKIFKGIYLYGSVGSGKSMICRLLFEKLKIKDKAYFHFHEFMQLVHKKMFLLRQNKNSSKESLIKSNLVNSIW